MHNLKKTARFYDYSLLRKQKIRNKFASDDLLY